MALVYQGMSLSSGIGIGRTVHLKKNNIEIPAYVPEDPAEEVKSFYLHHQSAVEETKALLAQAEQTLGAHEAEILDAQLTFLQDEYSVLEPIETAIREEKRNMLQAVDQVFCSIRDIFAAADDDYMRQRVADVEDIRFRLLSHMLGVAAVKECVLPENSVLLAKDLTPSDTMRLDLSRVCAIVTGEGSYYSHVGIITRNLLIPAIGGLGEQIDAIGEGVSAVVDAENGSLYLEPAEEELQSFFARRDQLAERMQRLEIYRTLPSCTKDGDAGVICANIGTPQEALLAKEKGAEGIGLMRSEFLYMDHRDLPGEEEQFAAYTSVLQTMKGYNVIIRTLDVGGDKELPSLSLPKEDNPFLGCRAIRLCLQERALFRTQLRALLRASSYGNLSIMLPMISSLEELRETKRFLREVQLELESEGVVVSPYRLGIMIEVPSAALLADVFAQEVDFFSIGTNDLAQYTLAAERGNASVAHLYDPCHPAVLRLIAMASRAARDHGILCGMCGEAAADEALLSVFWGMGIREFSMSAASVLPMRAALAQWSDAECRERAEHVLGLGSLQEVRQYLGKDPIISLKEESLC